MASKWLVCQSARCVHLVVGQRKRAFEYYLCINPKNNNIIDCDWLKSVTGNLRNDHD